MALVGQAVSEKKIFEIEDGRTDGRKTDDGRTTDHGHPISSPCEPNGSGELKNATKILKIGQQMKILCQKIVLNRAVLLAREVTIFPEKKI